MAEKLSAEELLNLVDPKSLEKLTALGGVETLASRLDSHRTKGLSSTKSNLEAKREFYGTNSLPQPTTKSFLQLVWGVIQAKILIVLIIAALVEIGIGVYKFRFAPRNSREQAALIDGFAILFAGILYLTQSLSSFSSPPSLISKRTPSSANSMTLGAH